MCSLRSVVQAGPSLSHSEVSLAAGMATWVQQGEVVGLAWHVLCPGEGLGDHGPCAAAVGIATWFLQSAVGHSEGEHVLLRS